MKYDPIKNSLFIKNRQNFTNKLAKNSVAFFNSNDIYPISADSTLPFEQHRDIFYLSGIDQEESVLVLFPDSNKSNYREILFLRETNDHIIHWEGEKLTKLDATKISLFKLFNLLEQYREVVSISACNLLISLFSYGSIFTNDSMAFASVIGMQELTRRANEIVVTEYRPLEIYSLLILEYLVLVLIISAGVRWLERKMGSNENQ